MFADAHCHLDDPALKDRLNEYISKAENLGFNTFISCGYSPERWNIQLDIAKKYPNVHLCFGIHPWIVSTFSPKIDKVCENPNILHKWLDIHGNSAVGVGEIGLDFLKKDGQKQIQLFREQLKTAADFNLPVVVHSVKAQSEVIKICKEYKKHIPAYFIHGFWGSSQEAQMFIKNGFYISLNSTVILKNVQAADLSKSQLKDKQNSQNILKKLEQILHCIPLDKLLLESDCNGNSLWGPEAILEQSGIISNFYGISPQELLKKTFVNLNALFPGLQV